MRNSNLIRKLLIIIAVLVVVVGAGYFAYRSYMSKVQDTAIVISSIPGDATVLLNGKQIASNGKLIVTPGAYTLTSSRNGFEDTKNSFTIKKGQTLNFYLYPKVSSPIGTQWLLDHPDDAVKREGQGGKQHAEDVSKAISQNSFITQLPYYGPAYEFRIDYGGPQSGNKYPDQPTIIITGATQQAQNDAITWMRSHGYDPDKMNITFVTATPE